MAMTSRPVTGWGRAGAVVLAGGAAGAGWGRAGLPGCWRLAAARAQAEENILHDRFQLAHGDDDDLESLADGGQPAAGGGLVMSPAIANSPWFWGRLIVVLAAVCVTPTIVAVARHVESIAAVVILNCFPVAWPAALILACLLPRKEPPL
ncbi:MAG TPA: hypothetical protein VN969_06395 [Streptosporangiaceae bacterium]|nr:hypothetical protein [Streptosporangiaceae bacterium]